MRSWYERYGVWMALAVFVLISIVSFAGFSQTQQLMKMMCSPGDKGDCLRQWVSATSGWFGGAITFATLLVLARQLNDVRTHHREMMVHSTRPTYLRAARVKDFVRSCRNALKLLGDAITKADQDGPTTEALFSIMAAVRGLRADLSRPEFDNFENDIGYVGIGTAFALRSSLQNILDYGNSIVEMLKLDPRRQIDDRAFSDFKFRASQQDYTRLYLDGICIEAEKFIEEWAGMFNRSER